MKRRFRDPPPANRPAANGPMKPPSRTSQPPPARVDWRQAVVGAIAMHRQGRLDEAEALYRQLLPLLPDDANLIHYYGVLLHQRHRVDEAMVQVRRSIELDPKVASWHNNHGNMLLDQHKPAEAAQAYLRCVTLDPDNVEVRSNLGWLLCLGGRLEESEAVLREAIARAPAYCDAHANLAMVLANQGRIDEAVDAGTRATELKPENPRSRRLLGMLYAKHGRRDMAAKVFGAWLTQSPDDPEARHHLAAMTGDSVPERASDAYVVEVFDRFAASFDAKLAYLGYRAPQLCTDVLRRRLGAPDGRCVVLDAGCGTGLCGPLLRAYASQLTGIDLSAGMLERSRSRHVYDHLEKVELSAWLSGCLARFDVVVSADTLCYFGALQPVLAAARRAVRPLGLLVYTVEALDEPAPEGYRLMHHGRYAHHRDAIERWLRLAGWQSAELEAVVLRQELGQPVKGWLVSAQAPATP
ncbi:MAG: tetratricopeptide repeat protein [Rhodoferax sp.]|nr:tetratricopeptide repeat protein [Rhodoferax sp.]